MRAGEVYLRAARNVLEGEYVTEMSFEEREALLETASLERLDKIVQARTVMTKAVLALDKALRRQSCRTPAGYLSYVLYGSPCDLSNIREETRHFTEEEKLDVATEILKRIEADLSGDRAIGFWAYVEPILEDLGIAVEYEAAKAMLVS